MRRETRVAGTLAVLSIVAACCIVFSAAINLDTVATDELKDLIKEDELILTFQNLKPKKRLKEPVETLFAVDYPGSRQKYILMLDRRHKRVIVETVENGKNRIQYFTVDSLDDSKLIDSIIFVANQRQLGSHVTLLLNCVSYGKVATPKSMRDMYVKMENPTLQVYTDRKHFAGYYKKHSRTAALSKFNCPTNVLNDDKNTSSNEKALDDDYKEQLNDEPELQHRGDIPLYSTLDDASILDALNKLITAVNRLTGQVGSQERTIDRLRQLIEECELCKVRPESEPIVSEPPPTCETHPPPCFPDVRCLNTPEGPRCGPCPRGYSGNGYQCVRFITCSERPCFEGVECRNTDTGYRCGPCPRGFTGNGEECTRIQGCEYNRCQSGQRCVDVSVHPYYQCENCPPGYTGDGKECTENIDECDLARPCDPNTWCVNLHPGFKCGPCPEGYRGEEIQGVGLEEAQRKRQRCYDINECEERPDICGPGAVCENTEGSYQCRSTCRGTYVEASFSADAHHIAGPCQELRRQDLCPDGTKCHTDGQCVEVYPRRYRCRCKFGYAGDGSFCARDSDLDGWPDVDLPCSERCKKDNCVDIPNSGQEDADGDGLGDKCDPDADNDRVPNESDNCHLVPNPNQSNSDAGGPDRYGDACDNCPLVRNFDQSDIDGDGYGDACDDDIDGDGIPNERDNCPRQSNQRQLDSDRDGIGDECDSCPNVPNRDQTDSDSDGIGDACDSGADKDRDGIPDERDNCPTKANSDQRDIDGDGKGDVCDNDKDGDSIPNNSDNCPLIYNPYQEDGDGDGVGDACDGDYDGDRIKNEIDNCPNNSLIHTTDFSKYTTVMLDPEGEAQVDPNWVVYDKGAEIWQTMNSDPGLAVGQDRFGGVDFEGTFYVNTDIDDDYAGFVFSYQSSKKFYVVMWKKNTQPYWQNRPFSAVAEPGIQLKLVNSETGPGKILRNALWHSSDTPGQVKVLWRDHRNVGWKQKTPYRWLLHHRPKIGLIRFKLFEGSTKVADSGNLFDVTLTGGRLGVFCFSQEMIIWSDLIYRCNDAVPQSIYDELPQRLRSRVEVDNSRIFSRIAYE